MTTEETYQFETLHDHLEAENEAVFEIIAEHVDRDFRDLEEYVDVVASAAERGMEDYGHRLEAPVFGEES
jgi:hypothetical protein